MYRYNSLWHLFLHFLRNFHEVGNISTNNFARSIDSYLIKYINGAPTFTYLHNNFLHLGKVMKQYAFTTRWLLKLQQHLWYHICIIKFTMEYDLIIHIFGRIIFIYIDLVKVGHIWFVIKQLWYVKKEDIRDLQY
jgi:hypothetical protein